VDGNQGAPQTVRAKARKLVPTDAVQRALTAHGYPLKDDGVAGPKTLQAIKDFQFAMGPAYTSGVVDLPTIKALGLKPTAIFFSIEAWIK
jgi:peptidoglycan hydrolase-like protein with peptidoglycan-binding domain